MAHNKPKCPSARKDKASEPAGSYICPDQSRLGRRPRAAPQPIQGPSEHCEKKQIHRAHRAFAIGFATQATKHWPNVVTYFVRWTLRKERAPRKHRHQTSPPFPYADHRRSIPVNTEWNRQLSHIHLAVAKGGLPAGDGVAFGRSLLGISMKCIVSVVKLQPNCDTKLRPNFETTSFQIDCFIWK